MQSFETSGDEAATRIKGKGARARFSGTVPKKTAGQGMARQGRIVVPSIVILTYNSEASLPETLESVISLSDDIYVVDSFSTDHTAEIAARYGARVVEHAFESYGTQRNWAIDSLQFKHKWQLHLDADERVTPELCQEIRSLGEDTPVAGFHIPRYLYFLGRPIRHGGMSPTWHMRLFKAGSGRCENRKYDQHFYVTSAQTAALKSCMIDDIRMSLSEWTVRHNRWSDAEVEEQSAESGEGRIKGNFAGNPVEKKRFWRQMYNNCPPFVRPFALFFYRYVLRLGFLDGSAGLIFYVLQTFWFRFLVDSKLLEKQWRRQRALGTSDAKVSHLVEIQPSAGKE
jgi:glycosyltransferase involved in cell wall biosynthesis